MLKRSAASVVVVVLMVSLGVPIPAATRASQVNQDLTVHEWGTFTTVAGEDGQAVQWLPLGGPADLPCFVYSFKNRLIKLGLPGFGPALDYQTSRTRLKGTVRMETPVLYFYASRPATVDVSVRFQKGLFTEWYPAAIASQMPSYQNLLVMKEESQAAIAWNDVRVLPEAPPAFPSEALPSHYYAARATDAAPVEVNGEVEKFLFYRGVAGFPSPISATLADNGTITVGNRSGAVIPRVVLFTKQGDSLGYRVHGAVRAQEHVVLEPPSGVHTFASLRQELERMLVAEGLYEKEAQAMVETWRDSWFEDGTRVFYIVPSSTVDAILPLRIEPQPASVVRVFVGRMEVIAPETVSAVRTAFSDRNQVALEHHGRLLGPIADRILASTTAPDERTRMLAQLDAALKSHAGHVARCGGEASPPTEQAPLALLPALLR